MTREEQPLVDTRKAADTLTAEGYPTSPATSSVADRNTKCGAGASATRFPIF